MSNCYSSRFVKKVNSADTNKLGVLLGNLCIDNDIPMKDVAEHFGVSLTTVCEWFKGTVNVPGVHQEKVASAVKALLEKQK